MKYRIDISKGVKIGAHHFPIKTGKSISVRLKEASLYGRCYNTETQLLIDEDLPETKFTETVIHEIIEAVSGVYCDSTISHRNICGLANGMTQVIDSLGITFARKKKKK